jgi:hypothetical protein
MANDHPIKHRVAGCGIPASYGLDAMNLDPSWRSLVGDGQLR